VKIMQIIQKKEKNKVHVVLPTMQYCIVPMARLEQVLSEGILENKGRRIELFSDVSKAKSTWKDRQEGRPIILGVLIREMYEAGETLYHYEKTWLIKTIPPKYLKRLTMVQTYLEGDTPPYGEIYLEDPNNNVMFRIAVYSRKTLRKFYGEKREEEVSRKNRMVVHAVRDGYEITQQEYKRGKQLTLKYLIHNFKRKS